MEKVSFFNGLGESDKKNANYSSQFTLVEMRFDFNVDRRDDNVKSSMLVQFECEL